MIEVVGILVAAGDGEDAGAQDVGNECGYRAGSRGSAITAASLSPLRAAARLPQQHHAAIRSDAPAVESGGDLLALHGWKRERQQVSSVMAGVARVRSVEVGFDTQIPLPIRSLRYIRQRIPALQ